MQSLQLNFSILLNRTILLLIVLFYFSILTPTISVAGITTLYQSVEQALNYSPEMQALAHNLRAVEYDLKQSRGQYLPSVDLLLGYGLENYSDYETRDNESGADDSDWDYRGDASLTLTQKVYDGGETSSQVSIQSALFDSAHHQRLAAGQAIALEAVTAHLNFFRQQQLLSLAEKNLQAHREIHLLLSERERTGTGNIADVTQVQARMARAESTFYLSQADLSQAQANYIRIIGKTPEDLAYSGVPDNLPQTLEEALRLFEQNSPELLILDAEISEAESRLSLARSKYNPTIDIELSSRYRDQVEGEPSWQNTNAAMLNLRWNLFNGGQDKAGTDAAISRKQQSRSKKLAKQVELTGSMSTLWAKIYALQRQKTSYQYAVDFSRKTLEAYMKQFSVSKRSLLDLLSAENEYFLSATQLINVAVNEPIAAYQILELTGNLNVPKDTGPYGTPEFITNLSRKLTLPIITPSLSPSP